MDNFRVIKGDLFDEELGFHAIGHGVNCKGAMGAGIAKVFRDKYPDMYDKYRLLCHYDILRPGGHYIYQPDGGPLVLNLASQDHLGANAKSDWYAQALYGACSLLGYGGRIGLPLIGAGIGGLTRTESIIVVSDVSRLLPGLDFTVVEL